MPSKSFPITITGPYIDTMLTVNLVKDPDEQKAVKVTVVNGALMNASPFVYTPGETNELQISYITSNTVYIILSDPVGVWVNDFTLTWSKLWNYSRQTETPLEYKYRALHNFYKGSGDLTNDGNYTAPFTTTALNFTEKSVLDLKLQASYDGSVNMIWTDDANPIRAVNSRFAVNEDTTMATLIDRRARKDSNTYSSENFHQTELIPKAISIPTLTFDGLVPGGCNEGGGYKYFFKYLTADGAETDIIEESRLVSVHSGTSTLSAVGYIGKPTPNAVSFTLTNLDQSFYGLAVYFTFSTGEVDAVPQAFRIIDPYIIENGGTCTIVHTGFENKIPINIELLSLTYSVISRSKTLDVVNNRLLVGNTEALDIYDQDLAQSASALKVEEGTFDISHHSRIDKETAAEENNYSNPKFIYDKLGYWKGETYELGIVFITSQGLSPVYPLQGIDNLDGTAVYNANYLGGLYRGFVTGGQNSSGIYRTADRKDLWTYDGGTEKLVFSGTKLKVNVAGLLALSPVKVKGFFFVRRPRKKDAIAQGLLTTVAAVPIETKFGPEYEISGLGNWCGVGVTSNVAKGNVKYVPAPLGMMAFGVEDFLGGAVPNTGTSTDFYIKAPIYDYELLKSWAFYSPDTECSPALYASLFNGSKVGVSCSKQSFLTEQINAATNHEAPLNKITALYRRISGSLAAYNPATELTGDKSAFAQYIESGSVGVAPKGFAGAMERNLYLFWDLAVGSADLTSAAVKAKITAYGATQFVASAGGKAVPFRPGNALAFGRYVGLKLEGLADASLTELCMASTSTTTNIHAQNSLIQTDNSWLDANGANQTEPQLGYVTTIFNSGTGAPLISQAWQARYIADEDTEYVAISRRYRLSDFQGPNPVEPSTTLDLYGGDCFLGLSWKQVWSPLGIPEAPQTNDITAYKTTRRALGLLPYGFAIPVPAQSNYNFNVRSKERVDEREFKVFGADRSFLPIRGKDSIRGNRQFETGAYNHGYSASGQSAFKQFRLNLNAPFYKFNYPNRIYVSEESTETQFANGFANFKGLNFRDYNSDLGAITKLIALNNVLICVFKDGVAQIGVDERSMLSQDTGGVYVDAAQVLSRSNVLNSSYGSSHLHAVCASNNFVYGVDFTRKKVWRTNGQTFEVISDLRIQNKLGSISRELITLAGQATGNWIDIYSHFDAKKNEIYFTFTTRDPLANTIISPGSNKARTLVFNETLDLWVCETNDTRKFVFQSNNSKYAFPFALEKFGNIYKYSIINQLYPPDPTVEVFGEYNKFYDNIYDMYFDYHVIDDVSLYKIFQNIYIIGNNSLPVKVTYTSDHNTETAQILKPYTNIRYPLYDTAVPAQPILVNCTQGSQDLLITQTVAPKHSTQDNLKYGDFISVEGVDAHTKYNFVVIEYVPGVRIKVDKPAPITFTNKQLFFGYGSNLPLRLSDAAFEESHGVITCQFNNRMLLGHSPTKLRGKWMRFKQTYEGTAPVYISGIITNYGISLS